MGAGALRNSPCPCGSGRKRKNCCESPLHARDGKVLLLGENARATPIQRLTGEVCSRTAASVRERLVQLGVSLGLSSELEQILRKLERLAARHPGALLTAPLTDQEKGDVRYIDQISRFAAVLAVLQSERVSGRFGRQLKRFREKLDALSSLTAPAQDLILELEVGAGLASGGLDVSFEEPPDLVVSGRNLTSLGVACKRPQSGHAVDSLVRKGIHQIRARELPGAILMCLDAVVNIGPNGKPVEWRSRSLSALQEGGWQHFKRTVEELQPSVGMRTDPNVVGIVWLARLLGVVVGGNEGPLLSRNTYLLVGVNMEHWRGRHGPLLRIADALNRGVL